MDKKLIKKALIGAGGTLLVGLVFGAGMLLGDITQESTPQESSQKKESESPRLIVGKWIYSGTNINSAIERKSVSTVEYFEDGTYQYYSSGIPPVLDPSTVNGQYVILSDGRLKTTHEVCEVGGCKEFVNLYRIEFPDPETLWQYYKDERGYSVYRKEGSPPLSTY